MESICPHGHFIFLPKALNGIRNDRSHFGQSTSLSLSPVSVDSLLLQWVLEGDLRKVSGNRLSPNLLSASVSEFGLLGIEK